MQCTNEKKRMSSVPFLPSLPSCARRGVKSRPDHITTSPPPWSESWGLAGTYPGTC
jgi:hypothetical protein